MREMVRAAVMTAPGKIRAEEFPYPKIPPNAALVKMEMSGICGTDKHMFRGETTHPSGQETSFPIIPGHENVGVIKELGADATDLEVDGREIRVGDRVVPVCDIACGKCYICRSSFGFATSCVNNVAYGSTLSCREPPHLFGGWAEYMYILPKALLAKVPEGLSPEEAVITEVLTVAVCGFNKAMSPYPLGKEGFAAGDVAVILGAGPLGICHGIMAKMMGAERVVVVGGPKFRSDLAAEICADNTINIDETMDETMNPDERLRRVMELTGGRGADLVAECAGVPDAVAQGLDMLRVGGTLIVAGNYIDLGSTSINPQKQILSKNARIIGVNGQTPVSYSSALKLIKRFSDSIPVEKMVTHRFKIEDAERAMQTALSMNSMEVVITP